MVKTVSLPDAVYDDLVLVSKELEAMAKKPMSLGMAVYLLTAVYRSYISEPCARDSFCQRLANADIMSPEEFEKACETAEP
ncbi:MAG: hypothetical protein NWF04_02515 [Candidatus Bathyarchaeota archaeon]|nr:hypothetical protein [Candidatus Bathyarchaeota archaeon]